MLALARDESRSIRLRGCAVGVLARIRDPRAAEPLLRMLQEGPVPLRQDAAEALVALGSPGPLLPMLDSAAPAPCSVRAAAAAALGRGRGPGVLPALARAARSGDSCVRAVAVASLADVGRDPGLLLPFLKDADAGVRIAAAFGAARLGDRRSVRPLLEALGREGDIAAQRAMARSLRDFADPRAAEPLLALLGRGNAERVRGLLERRPGTTRAYVEKDLALYRADIAEGLAYTGHPSVEKAFFDALYGRDLAVLRGAVPFFVKRAVSGRDALLEAFDSAGERSECMAALFLRSGDRGLVRAAQDWLEIWPQREQRRDGLPQCGLS
jgi:HEAT repeat protein